MHIVFMVIVDINECDDATVCNTTTSSCENNFGSFECVCLDGFEKENDDCIGRLVVSIQFSYSMGAVVAK